MENFTFKNIIIILLAAGVSPLFAQFTDCVDYDLTDFEYGFEFWEDGGADVMLEEDPSGMGTCALLRDNSGAASSIYTYNLPLAGVTELKLSFTFKFESMEIGEDLILDFSVDAGQTWGTIETWVSGQNVENDVVYNEVFEFNGFFTNRTRFRFRADGSSNYDRVLIDDILMEVCNTGCVNNAPCDDSDPCTTDDKYDADCNCYGTFADSDGDGICNFDDQCEDLNDMLIGMSCDDGDECTTGDVYTNDCECRGVFADEDEDGFCSDEDPDDLDACVPDASFCNSVCTVMISDDFEAGLGSWNDGGTDCALSFFNGMDNSRSLRLRDNSGTSSSAFTDAYNLSDFTQGKLEFSYLVTGMSFKEDFFFELSLDGGNTWELIEKWAAIEDFQLNRRYNEIVYFETDFTANTRFRFRSDASSNADRVYLDEISISACMMIEQGMQSQNNEGQNAFAQAETTDENERELEIETQETVIESSLEVYPNPVADVLNLSLKGNLNTNIESSIYSISGQLMMHSFVPADGLKKGANTYQVDLSELEKGAYFLKIKMDDKIQTKKIIVLE